MYSDGSSSREPSPLHEFDNHVPSREPSPLQEFDEHIPLHEPSSLLEPFDKGRHSCEPPPTDTIDASTANEKAAKSAKYIYRTQIQRFVLVKYNNCPKGIRVERGICGNFACPSNECKFLSIDSWTVQRHAIQKHCDKLDSPPLDPELESESTWIQHDDDSHQENMLPPPQFNPVVHSTPSTNKVIQRGPATQFLVSRPKPGSSKSKAAVAAPQAAQSSSRINQPTASTSSKKVTSVPRAVASPVAPRRPSSAMSVDKSWVASTTTIPVTQPPSVQDGAKARKPVSKRASRLVATPSSSITVNQPSPVSRSISALSSAMRVDRPSAPQRGATPMMVDQSRAPSTSSPVSRSVSALSSAMRVDRPSALTASPPAPRQGATLSNATKATRAKAPTTSSTAPHASTQASRRASTPRTVHQPLAPTTSTQVSQRGATPSSSRAPNSSIPAHNQNVLTFEDSFEYTTNFENTGPSTSSSRLSNRPTTPLTMLVEHQEPNVKTEAEASPITIPAHYLNQVFEILSDEETDRYNAGLPPPLDWSQYIRTPDKNTIISDDRFNLKAFGIVINTALKCIICLECGRAVDYTALPKHISRLHTCYAKIPPTLSEDLKEAFGLVPLSKTPYPSTAIAPVFGVRLFNEPIHFCCACHHGYLDPKSLKTHQSDKGRCPGSRAERNSYVSYGQFITGGPSRRYFPIDISTLQKRRDAKVDYSDVFGRTLPPPVDYTKLPMQQVEDEHNLNQFLHRERWHEFTIGYQPEEMIEACRMPSKELEPWGIALKEAARRYLFLIRQLIPQYQAFGFLKVLMQVTPNADTTHHNFNLLDPDSVRKYGDVLTRVIFNTIRHLEPTWKSSVYYPPLSEEQQNILMALRQTLEGANEEEIDNAFHQSCFTLFGHAQFDRTTSAKLGKFFSPVIAFVVYASVRENGNFDLASNITQTLSALEYAIRSTMFIEALYISSAKRTSSIQALRTLDKYYQNHYETPMAFIYNTHRLLAVIRSNEMNPTKFVFTDGSGQSLTHNGKEYFLTQFKNMAESELDRYRQFVQQELFFGETIPSECKPTYEIEDLCENLQNTSVGYSFIDDPRNSFDRYRNAYGKWLLSDPDRAENYVYVHEGKICWKPAHTLHLLAAMQKSREILAPEIAGSPGPMIRGAEFARATFRNLPGAQRNLQILYHLVTLVSIQDKTSHRTVKDLYVPHALTREWATELINQLVIFRQFEEHIVELLLDEEALHRYRFQLWPELSRTMTADRFREILGDVTEKYLPIRVAPTLWRGLVTAFAQYMPDAAQFLEHKQFFIDTAMMHSTDMSVQRYNRTDRDAPGTDFRTTLGCIVACLNWQRHINIGQDQPFKVFSHAEVVGSSTHGHQSYTLGQLSPTQMRDMARQLAIELGPQLAISSENTLFNALAGYMAVYGPPIPQRLDDNHLRPISNTVVHPSRLKGLRNFLRNNSASFSCPEQGVLLELMIQGQQSILGILGTGTGKTMTVMMHAKMYGCGRVTLIVLPLSGLHADLERRARASGVSISRWQADGKFNSNVNIVYVSIEHIGYTDFKNYLVELEASKCLHIIVFDEIHKVLTDKGYRQQFEDFYVLNLVKTIIVGLTGTLPPNQLSEFLSLTRTTWKIIRMPSSRREIEYDVRHVKSTINTISQDVMSYIANYGPNDRLMIFCRTHDTTVKLAKALNVVPYTSQTTDTNVMTMERWLKGERPVMVSTSILGCGLDYPSVRHVIHCDLAYSMLDQHQQESRGGRDGRPCKAITYFPIGRQQVYYTRSGDSLGASELYTWAMSTNQCLRSIPSLYLDGISTTCMLLPGCALCSFCARSMSEDPPEHTQSMPTSLTKEIHIPKRLSFQAIADLDLSQDTDMFPLTPDLAPQTEALPEPDANDLTTSSVNMSFFNETSSSAKRHSIELDAPNKRIRLSDAEMSSPLATFSSVSMTQAKPTGRAGFHGPTTQIRVNDSDMSSPLATLSSMPMTQAKLTGRIGYSKPTKQSVPGVAARFDVHIANQRLNAYANEVRVPMEKTLLILKSGCIWCCLKGTARWDKHHFEKCVTKEGKYVTKDGIRQLMLGFYDFKSKFLLPVGWCFYCLLNQPSFRHPLVTQGYICKYDGILSRFMYAFLWMDLPIFDGYPNMPTKMELDGYRSNMESYRQWALEDVPGKRYPGNEKEVVYVNIYDLFLWTMRQTGLLP